MEQLLSAQPHVNLIPNWQKAIWTLCALILMGLILALVGLVGAMLWRLLDLLQPTPPDNAFVFSSVTVLCSSLLRLLAIIIGGAIAFAGLAVSFFTHEKETNWSMNAAHENVDAKTALATHSPGILGVIIGAIVIIVALFLRGEHIYTPPEPGVKILRAPPPLEEVFKDGSKKSSGPEAIKQTEGAKSAPIK